jgi:hypothetical protein
MPRGRPRKIPLVEEDSTTKTAQQIIAEVAHDNCMIPGCRTIIHFAEASDIIDTLKQNGYEIRKMS